MALRLVPLALAIAVIAMAGGPWAVSSVLLRDAPLPPNLKPSLEAARASVSMNIEGIGPVHIRFVRAHCRADGGSMFVFETRGVLLDGLAFAVQGANAMSFAGGVQVSDPEAEAEDAFRFFSESPEVACGS